MYRGLYTRCTSQFKSWYVHDRHITIAWWETVKNAFKFRRWGSSGEKSAEEIPLDFWISVGWTRSFQKLQARWPGGRRGWGHSGHVLDSKIKDLSDVASPELFPRPSFCRVLRVPQTDFEISAGELPGRFFAGETPGRCTTWSDSINNFFQSQRSVSPKAVLGTVPIKYRRRY